MSSPMKLTIRTGRQRGAVLVIGLVMLTVMTLLVVSMMKTSIIDLKIGGVTQDNLVNVNNADVILNTYYNEYSGKFSSGCMTQPGANTCNPAFTGWTAPQFSASCTMSPSSFHAIKMMCRNGLSAACPSRIARTMLHVFAGSCVTSKTNRSNSREFSADENSSNTDVAVT